MITLLLLIDFNTLALSTDRIREREPNRKSSLKQPQAWYLPALIFVGCILGIMSVIEIRMFFWYAEIDFSNDLIHFQTMNLFIIYFFCSFTVMSVRERSWYVLVFIFYLTVRFYRSRPSLALITSIVANSNILVIVCVVDGLYFISELSIPQMAQMITFDVPLIIYNFDVIGFRLFVYTL